MDIGEDMFAGSGIVGLNFDPIRPEPHSDLGYTTRALLAKVAHVTCIDSQRNHGWALNWVRAQTRCL